MLEQNTSKWFEIYGLQNFASTAMLKHYTVYMGEREVWSQRWLQNNYAQEHVVCVQWQTVNNGGDGGEW